jgi:hypothetical protein
MSSSTLITRPGRAVLDADLTLTPRGPGAALFQLAGPGTQVPAGTAIRP